jgi:microcystin-dependent protein
MTEPYLGEVQILGCGYAPFNWSLANGQLVPVQQASSLYALYGATFGGNGSTVFGLPNLASRMGGGVGQSPGNSFRRLGQSFGVGGVSLSSAEMPAHGHSFKEYQPEGAGTQSSTPAAGSGIGSTNTVTLFGPATPPVPMNGLAVTSSGTGAAHENRQPFLGLVYAVAMSGVFPSFG